jgi:hypothetical protein
MFRLCALCVAFGLLWAASHAQADGHPAKFPQISAKKLNDMSATFPSDLPGNRTFVPVAFKREQQADLDLWMNKLGLVKSNATAWAGMPIVADCGNIWRALVDNGIRFGIKTVKACLRVFTVYGSRNVFTKLQTSNCQQSTKPMYLSSRRRTDRS